MRSKLTRSGLAVLAGAALLATACSPDESGNGSGNGEPGSQEVTIEWGFWAQSDAANERWDRLAARVTEEYPNITVTRTAPPFADYFTRLQAQLASNTVPCVVSMQSLRLPAFVEVMEPLQDLMGAEGFDADDWNPAALTALQVDETQYAIPFGISTMLMYYDMDAFEEAGVPFPETDWTIADFEAAAQEITAATGKPAFGQSFSDLHMFSFLHAYNGAVPVTEDGELDLTNDAMRDAFTWYAGLSTEQQVALTPASSSEIPWGEQQLVSGNTAMAVDGSWNLASNAIDANFRLGVTTVPVGEGGISSFSANSGFGISRSCEHKEEAAKVISILTSEEAQAETAESGTQPARAGIDDLFYEGLDNDLAEKNPGYSELARTAVDVSSETAVPFVPTDNWDQAVRAIAREFILAYTGDSDPEAALEAAQSAS